MMFQIGSPRSWALAGVVALVAGGTLLTPSIGSAQDDPPRKKRESGQPPREEKKAEGDENEQRFDELQKLREKLKARMAELEKLQGGGGGDAEKMREKMRERFGEMMKERQGGGAGNQPGMPDLQRLREELQARKAQMEEMQKQMQRKSEELQKLEKMMAERMQAEKQAEKEKQFDFKFKKRPDDRDGQRKPGDGGPRGDNTTQRAGGDLERRLDELERKLDTLIREMRRDNKGPRPQGGDGEAPQRKSKKEAFNFEIELNPFAAGRGEVRLNRPRSDGFAQIPVAPRRVDPNRDEE